MLPFDAIERMVASASESGSDLVSGVADRFNSTETWRSGMYKPLFNRDTMGTHISNQTDLLFDHIACSKLYRAEFGEPMALSFRRVCFSRTSNW